MKLKKVIVFGTGDIAQLAKYYFDIDSSYEVVAFTVDKDYCLAPTFENLPLVPFEEIEKHFPCNEVEIFIALSYAQMNKLRETKFLEAKKMNYKIASYISSKCSYLSQFPPGENAFIFPNVVVEPYATVGNNCVLWSGAILAHHSKLLDNCFMAPGALISGRTIVNNNCFFGVNSTVRDNLVIEKNCIIGAGAIIKKNTVENGVYSSNGTLLLNNSSFNTKV